MNKAQAVKIDHWYYRSDPGTVSHKQHQHTLKPLLNKLLLHFVSQPETVFSVEQLKQQVWQQEFLTDSAVKKAISELRQQIRQVSGSDEEYIKNIPGQGYYFDKTPKDVKHASRLRIAATAAILLAISGLIWLNVSPQQLPNKPHGLPVDAQTLYLQGKSLYYKGGPAEQVESLLTRSIKLHPQANPAHGALLDLWGLQLRSVKTSQRSVKLQQKVDEHINNLLEHPDYQSTDNLVALAKYYLVNEGALDKAATLMQRPGWQFEQAYDAHVVAFTLALSEEGEKAQQIMAMAERRTPDRNVTLWYKSLVSLASNDIAQAKNEAVWAQQLAPDWYPLAFVISHLLSLDEESAWQHLKNFSPAFLGGALSEHSSFASFLHAQKSVSFTADYQPFEVEILYFLGIHFANQEIKQSARAWIAEHFPEKQLMLRFIDNIAGVTTN